MPSIVFIPADLEPAKIVQTAIYGGTLVGVEGSYDDVNRLCSRARRDRRVRDDRFRQRQRPAVLRRGVQDARLRGRRATRLAAARPGRGADGVGLAADQDAQGVQGTGRGRPRPGVGVAGVRCAVGGLLADRDGVRQRLGRGAAGQADRHRQVAEHRQPGRRAVRARRGPLHRRRDGGGGRRRDPRRASACSLARPACSPRRRAASRSRCCASWSQSGAIDTSVETVVYNTGDGLKTIDAISEAASPTAVIPPTLKGMRAAGLL